jgi:excisionase family DNA binding protein
MVDITIDSKLAFSRPEVAAVTGLSVRTIDNLIKRGVLPHRKIGKRVLVGRAALEGFLNARNGAQVDGATTTREVATA